MRPLAIWITALVAIPLFLVIGTCLSLPSAKMKYDTLAEKLAPPPLPEGDMAQGRESVHKQLLLEEEGKRKLWHMRSDTSDLILLDVGRKMEIKEQFIGVSSHIQETLNRVDDFVCPRAAFHWGKRQLLALDPSIVCKENGATVLKATGQEAKVDFTTFNNPSLEVHKLKATLFNGEEIEIVADRGCYLADRGHIEGLVRLKSSGGYTVECGLVKYLSDQQIELLATNDVPKVHLVTSYKGDAVELTALKVELSSDQPLIASGQVYLRVEGQGALEANTVTLTLGPNREPLKVEGVGNCSLTLQGLGCINSNALCLDIPKEEAHFEEARGQFSLFAFESKGLYLQGRDHSNVYLEGPLRLSFKDQSLNSKGPLEFCYHHSTGLVEHCTLKGLSEAVLQVQGEPIALHFEGIAHFDGAQLKMQSDPGKKLKLNHQLGEVRGELAIVDIKRQNPFACDKISIEGDVYVNHALPAPPELGLAPLQYALADQLVFYPEKQEMVLTAKELVRVFDNTNGVEMSAKEVQLGFGEGGERLQGVGDVRFKFSNQSRE